MKIKMLTNIFHLINILLHLTLELEFSHSLHSIHFLCPQKTSPLSPYFSPIRSKVMSFAVLRVIFNKRVFLLQISLKKI